MSHPIVRGSTDQSTVIRIVDATDGTPETGVVWNTSGIDLWYRREGGLRVAITEATLATVDAAHADGGFIHIGDGYYRVDLPDAAVATGANFVTVGGTVTGMVVIAAHHALVSQVALNGSGHVTLADGSFSAAKWAANAIDANAIAANALTSAKFNDGFLTAAKITGALPANITQVNSIAVAGSGTSAAPWGPA